MPRFAANLSMLFGEVEFLDRFAAAADAGFAAVEIQFPYAWPAETVAARLEANDLVCVLINLPAGDWDAGDRGLACRPDRAEAFRDGLDRALDYAGMLAAPKVNCLAGVAPSDADPVRVAATFLGNLSLAAEAMAEAGRELVVEPVNTHDVPGFYVSRVEPTLKLLDRARAPVGLQLDLYHAARMGEPLPGLIRRHAARIRHVQAADVPGRHEPGTGQLQLAELFALLDEVGYDGWIGAEYRPAGATIDGLGWLAPYRTGAA